FMLSSGCIPGNDQRFRWARVEAARNFANKIWNASRFALMHLAEARAEDLALTGSLTVSDRWILHRLNETIAEVTRHLNRYDFGEAGRVVYHFIWDEFWDWYIEFSKLSLYGEDEEAKRVTRAVLCHVLDRALRLLHPFMPFITEEIWQKLPGTGPSITVAEWPEADEAFQAPDAVRDMQILIDVIRSVRNIRSEMEVPPNKQVSLLIRTEPEAYAAIRDNESAIRRLCGADKVTAGPDVTRPDKAMTAVVSGAEVFLSLEGMIVIEETIARVEKELKKLDYEG